MTARMRRHDARLLDLARPLGLAGLDSCSDRVGFHLAVDWNAFDLTRLVVDPE
jgi:hypothetical protein